MQRSPTPWLRLLPLASLLFLQLTICFWVWLEGPAAISDDDYARVVIAQAWAQHPRLDPTGTSWLPFPFYVTGAAMFLLGTALDVAREVQVLLALASSTLLYLGARRLGHERWPAVLSAALGASLPNVARFAPATVPEYPTAACLAFGLLCLVGKKDHETRVWSLLGAGATYLACASRYEAWPIAGVYAGVMACRAWQAHGAQERRWLTGAAIIAAAFPFLWLLHGVVWHQNPFFFVARVTRYKAALGASSPDLSAAWLGYPLALVRQELGATFLLGGATFLATRTDAGRTALRALWPLLLAAVVLLVVLVSGDVRGGAPTHHPERALLSLWLIVPAASLHLLGAASLPNQRALVPSLLLGAALVTALFRVPPGAFANRAEEERLGRMLEKTSGQVVLLTPDYGHFAVQAASGRPDRFLLLDRHDPRDPRPAASPEEQVRAALGTTKAPWAVVPLGVTAPGYRIVKSGARLMLLERGAHAVGYAFLVGSRA
jgi:4-amino-4-deoxy-L-arabinose transferase-like glycosyltransferase